MEKNEAVRELAKAKAFALALVAASLTEDSTYVLAMEREVDGHKPRDGAALCAVVTEIWEKLEDVEAFLRNGDETGFTSQDRELLKLALECLRDKIWASNRVLAAPGRETNMLETADNLYHRLTGNPLIDKDVTYFTGLPATPEDRERL